MFRRKSGGYGKDGGKQRQGMTLVEVLVAMAVIVIIFAAIVPQIRAIRNSWDSKRENVEVIQNGRVLIDHIATQLAQANSITAVSDSNTTNGYIQFLDNDGNAMRYEINGSNYVVYGPPGNLSELAGPVSQLQFKCYDACNLDVLITDVNSIRTVKVRTTITNSAELGRDQTFNGQAYLRTNAGGGGGGDGKTVTEEPASQFNFSAGKGQGGVLCRIDATHHLCVYKSEAAGKGYAVVLIVNTGNWAISKGAAIIFDSKNYGGGDLACINATDYLCAYPGDKGNGSAIILTVNPATWAITKGTLFQYDTSGGGPALSQIDSTNYLCTYRGAGNSGWAVILTVNTVTKTVTKGTLFNFETTTLSSTPGTTLANIDNVHHLCAYEFLSGQGMAVVLTVNTVTKTVTKQGTAFQFEATQAMMNELIKIDQNHYLCAYRGATLLGNALILTVNTGTWAISKGTTCLYTQNGQYPVFAWISGDNYLCAYTSSIPPSHIDIGKAIVFSVNTQTDLVTNGAEFVHDDVASTTPDLSRVDDSHYLCVYEGLGSNGFATILTVGSPVLP